MGYDLNIDIYKLKMDINTPLMSAPHEMSNTKIGDFIFIIGDKVYIKNPSVHDANKFLQTLYNAEFVRANSKIFEKIQ